MFGDLIGISGRRYILIQQHNSTQAGVSGNVSRIIAPQPRAAGFKITENESARPTDRVFFNYNFYSNVDRLFAGTGLGSSDFHREMLGFEKTFFDGNASIGLRVPFSQLTGNNGVEDRHLDDISLIFKYALVNNCTTGNVLSMGMVVTAPTGDDLHVDGQSAINPWIFQPFLGYVYHLGDFYVQGFSSLAVPTDDRDVRVWFNSVSFGYNLYRCDGPERLLKGITPVAELHLNTPLNHRGLESFPVGFSDSLNFTGGFFFNFQRTTLGLAAGTPLTGPRPYDYEVTASLNFRF
jgi:hypothetical protein